MAANTVICNLSLGHLGISKTLSNVETDRSKPALSCKTFYDQALKQVFRDFVWPFANTYAELALVESSPNDDWDYSYRYPSSCSRLIKILSGIRNDNRQSRISFEVASDDDGRLIYTDQKNACVKFSKIITDTNLYSQDFVMAFSFLLAFYIAPSITAGDPFKLGERAFNSYILMKSMAESNAVNEQQDDEEPESEFIRSRE